MDPALRQRMLEYYDERSAEYEEAYTRGTGTASITDPTVFTRENSALIGVVAGFGQGHLIDLGCGTAYWLPHYAARCTRVTLIDQSEKMLAESEAKIRAIGISDRCELIRADILDYQFSEASYDCALIGFVVSHLSEDQERGLFRRLRRMLRPPGEFLILESAWTEVRARFNEKAGRQPRRLNDGTTFDIYKRYFDTQDVADWSAKHGVETKIEYFGDALCAVSGTFRGEQ